MPHPYALASLALVQIGPDKRPVGYASGCLVRYKAEMFLLSVDHATGNGGNWAVQHRYDAEKGVELFSVGEMNFIQVGRLKNSKLRDVDFSYKRLTVPMSPVHQEFDDQLKVSLELPKTVLNSELSAIPNGEHTYGFFGLTQQRLDGALLHQVPKLEVGMRYVNSAGDYHEFELLNPYRKIAEYQGCSGAPILDEAGTLVALVVEGNKRKTRILGLNLSAYAAVIDAQFLVDRN